MLFQTFPITFYTKPKHNIIKHHVCGKFIEIHRRAQKSLFSFYFFKQQSIKSTMLFMLAVPISDSLSLCSSMIHNGVINHTNSSTTKKKAHVALNNVMTKAKKTVSNLFTFFISD
jgi:hypothetical protein